MFRITLVAFIFVFLGSGFNNNIQNLAPHTIFETTDVVSAETASRGNMLECVFYRENPFGNGNHYTIVTGDNYFIADEITLYSDRDCQLSYSTKDSAGYVYSTTGGETPLTICRNNGADDVYNVSGDFYICIAGQSA